MINKDLIVAYLCQINLAYDLNADEVFWLDNSLIWSDDVIVGFSCLHLKHYVILRFIVYIDLTGTLPIFFCFPENHCVRRVQVNHLFPVNYALDVQATTHSTTLLKVHYDFLLIF